MGHLFPGVRQRAQVFLCFLFLLCSLSMAAQQFVVRGSCGDGVRSHIILTIFDGDSSYQTLRSPVRDSFYFTGSVRQPVLASLTSPKMDGTLYFYLENSNISIVADMAHPQASRIVGSRTNSQFRYAVEDCVGGDEVSCVESFVRNNSTSVFSPFLLYERLTLLPSDRYAELFQLLDGPARHAYHYHLAARRVAREHSVTEGQPLPDFVFADENGKEQHFDSLRADSVCNVLLVGATWCASCRAAEQQLLDLQPQVMAHTLQIDKQPRRWDAPCLQQLVVDHVPYIILVDAKGRIAGRDLRIWELTRRLREAGCPVKNQK